MSEKITLHYNDAINSTFIIETEGEHELTNGFLKVTDVDDEENLIRVNYFDLCDVTRVEVVHYLPEQAKAEAGDVTYIVEGVDPSKLV